MNIEPTIRTHLGVTIYFYSIQQIEHLKHNAEVNRQLARWKSSASFESDSTETFKEQQKLAKYIKRVQSYASTKTNN